MALIMTAIVQQEFMLFLLKDSCLTGLINIQNVLNGQ